jgi:hemerythrin-like domain-containing protein
MEVFCMAKRQTASAREKQPATRRTKTSGGKRQDTAHRHSNRVATPRPSSGSTKLTATAEAVGRALGRTTAAIADHLPWSGKPDGLTLLERDHRRLEALLAQADEATADAERTTLLAAIANELKAHELIEEKVLYPVLKSHADAKDIVLEGYQEHHVADLVLNELQHLPPSDERWGAKLTVLKENIEHHIEEEEGEMFKTARSILSDAQLEDIGQRMQALKETTAPRSTRHRR